MTDMPEFRAWADRAFASAMRPPRARKRKPTRYKCIGTECHAGTTLIQAQANGCVCRKCGADLISKAKLEGDLGIAPRRAG
jgi:hypothetical protein